MADMRLVVAGASGRMGQTLIRMIAETPGVVLAGAIERTGSPAIGQDAGRLAGLDANGVIVTDDPLSLLTSAEGIIDFTAPAATVELAALAAQMRIVHVIGTTGLSKEDFARLRAAARHAVIVQSGNMSLGVNLLAAVVKRVAKSLDADFDIEVLEMHHNRKVDAPSGTALMLGQAAADGRGIDLDANADRVRDGHPGAREKGHIGFATLRGGTVVGEHSVIFAGENERLEFSHKAESRTMFARGALKAVLWGFGRKPGYYSMADVLGLGDF
ncbi:MULTISPECIES: 4-hydroxy-tetrahydrodipicolinate reductase [Labrys]|uniref:4-hydroxy-tetrahydrodipicolinate reductase n=1 Tax=Labrys TaxID=204476 RepID=UPI000AE813E7|nr:MULTISPECIES: 4-hydroxy-tetrahydrodipicolinate reductase [unclassified Labrys (in: a-proteobacteria)]MDZ5450953.1 4-hydroxy-tetrahydrodipicolinate reductase [Labrys sp. ZIDIC5]